MTDDEIIKLWKNGLSKNQLGVSSSFILIWTSKDFLILSKLANKSVIFANNSFTYSKFSILNSRATKKSSTHWFCFMKE